MKTMKDYHDLHLKRDILLLVDVFEKFRNKSSKNFGLRASHYLSALLDAMFKMTKIKVELIPDSDMTCSFYISSNKWIQIDRF